MPTFLPTLAALAAPFAFLASRATTVPHPVGLSFPALALVLIVAAVIALAVNPRDGLVRLFALLLLTCAVVVTTEPLFEQRNFWGRAILVCADGLAASLFSRFCLAFPTRHGSLQLPAAHRLRSLYTYGPIVPMVTAIAYVGLFPQPGWLPTLGIVCSALGTTFGVLLGLGVLGRIFLDRPERDVRAPILVVWLGAAAAFLPLLGFNVLPAVFSDHPVVPFAWIQYGLISLPLAVGFATVRWRTVSLLALFDRVSVYVLVGLVLLAGYFGLALGLAQLEGDTLNSTFGLLPLALGVVAATTFAPLRARIQRFVDTVLYRDYYDLGPTLQRFSRSLATVRDQTAVANSLLDDLCETLNLSGAALILLPGGLDPAILRLIEPDDLMSRRDYVPYATRAALVAQLAALDVHALDVAGHHPLLLDPFSGCAALLLIGPGGGEDVAALLLIGRKRGGGSLRPEDRTLLSTVSHQAATALENATLVGGLRTTLTQLRTSAEQLEVARAEQQLLLREVVDADERQRAALAKDIHDDALNDLVYVSRHSRYCAGLFSSLLDAEPAVPSAALRVREELDALAHVAATTERKLRDLCAGLYPALLESLGLPFALEALAEDATTVGDLRVSVACSADAEPLAEQLDAVARLHAYRIAQESVRNASRHARARHATIALDPALPQRRGAHASASSPRLILTISDDGTGIRLPVDYVSLLRERHLGLASMRDRAERIGAELTLGLNEQGGTRVTLALPVSESIPVHPEPSTTSSPPDGMPVDVSASQASHASHAGSPSPPA
jgi:signal transduction histidine kinase